MLNANIGLLKTVRGRTMIETDFGRTGHAVYGPYVTLPAGDYRVGFRVSAIDLGKCSDTQVVATVDVSRDYARSIAASQPVTAGQLREGQTFFPLSFHLPAPSVVEYRIGVEGTARLEMDGYCPVVAGADALERVRFPEVGGDAPDLLRRHEDRLRYFYEKDFGVVVVDGGIVMSKDGIRFHVRTGDDVNLIEEIFIEQVYRFESKRPTVLVDIGMNIGLVAMQFASNPAVEKVYSFEPFASTYERALANLALNPRHAAKIVASNTGIGDADGPVRINVHDTDDSGSRSTRDADGADGVSVELRMQLAPTVIERIIAAEPGRDIIVKVDCEGAEFSIFEKLEQHGVLDKVAAFMVEWHTVFPGKSQADLIAPLIRAGFIVFDRSPRAGNGFFYAVKQG